jgi:histidinol-phosphate phosphatase family protein
MTRRAVFFDRDGTVITERKYLLSPKKLRFYRGAIAAMRRLQDAGYRIVIITNQSAVGRGWLTLPQLARIHRVFKDRCRRRGVRIDGIYVCPHLPDGGCACRKPKPLMGRRAVRDLRLDAKRSFMIGDQARDMQFARNLGARGVLVLTGSGRSQRRMAAKLCSKVTSNLTTAAQFILSAPSISK